MFPLNESHGTHTGGMHTCSKATRLSEGIGNGMQSGGESKKGGVCALLTSRFVNYGAGFKNSLCLFYAMP